MRSALLVGLAACAVVEEPQPADTDSPVVDETDTDEATGPTDPPLDTAPPPCELHGLVPGEDARIVTTWEGRERVFWLHVPADYDCTPRPVLIGLHFFGGEAHAAELDTLRAHGKLNRRGWFGLFPQALAETPGGTWTSFNDLTSRHDTGPDGPTCTPWAYEQPTFDTCPPEEADRECHWGTSCADDVGWVRSLLGELSTDFAVDADHIFLTGFSQGGVAAQGWACPLGDLLAAVAPLHGFSANGYACGPSDGVSLMQAYGYWDLFVNGYDQPSADGLIYESAAETAAAWAEAQGCSPDGSTRYRTVSDGKLGWGCTQHADCATGADVVSCEWDGSHFMGRDPVNGDFMMDAVWQFFDSHPRQP